MEAADNHLAPDKPTTADADPPAWSIVVPAYNRPARLQSCLDALSRLDAPPGGFEVVVIDDGSSPALEQRVRLPDGLEARVIRQTNAGPASARNSGVREARGGWIAFTDDDCQPHPGWLMALACAIDGHEDRIAGGHTINALKRCLPAAASQSLIDYLHDYFNTRTGGPTFFPSNNFCIARSAYDSLAGFDERFPLAAGEDRDFCDKALHAGMTLVYEPDAQIDHYHAMSLRGFWRQHFNYGRGAYAFHLARADRADEAVRVEKLGFYTGLLLYPLRRQFSLNGLAQSFLMGVSQVANVLGYARARFTAGRSTKQLTE